MANKIPRVSVREQEPAVRATNFEEVCYGYNAEEAQLEATRCLNCKNPRCVSACPVGINIPGFVSKIAEGYLSFIQIRQYIVIFQNGTGDHLREE